MGDDLFQEKLCQNKNVQMAPQKRKEKHFPVDGSNFIFPWETWGGVQGEG